MVIDSFYCIRRDNFTYVAGIAMLLALSWVVELTCSDADVSDLPVLSMKDCQRLRGE
ncbi:MAG: hypothetical protein ACJA04_000450 [Cellvibrionaceae bacterium]|jgi:hypothetical protein